MMSKPKKYNIDIELDVINNTGFIKIHLPTSDVNWLKRLSGHSFELWNEGIREGLISVMREQGRTIERGECH